MGVNVRKKNGQWYVFINHHGQRKAKCIGENRAAAVQVKRVLETKLALGDIGVFGSGAPSVPRFGEYSESWLENHAKLSCKPSTIDGYESVLRQHIWPWFSSIRLNEIRRNDIKEFIGKLKAKELTRSTIRNAISILRGIFNQAIEDGLIESNPAANLGRFTRAVRSSDVKGVALTPEEVEKFLAAAEEVCPEYTPLFLLAVRAGLRRGELVALQWQDLEFGKSDRDPNRFILVQHNYVRREHTNPKSKKARRVDMSRELRGVLMKLRGARLAALGLTDSYAIAADLVFKSQDGSVLDPDNLYHRYFVPVLKKSGIRKIRLHDLRHTFGSQLLQKGASVVYVKEQMGHSSIQVTVDTYGHLVPSANVGFVDRLDAKPEKKRPKRKRPNATQAQPLGVVAPAMSA